MRSKIVSAIIAPVASVIKTYVGDDPDVIGIEEASEIDPPPGLGVTIDLRGNLVGPITCVVCDELARLIAQRMAATPDVDDALCEEAVNELANIITGNTTERLREAGYSVEISPPRTVSRDDGPLTEKTVVVVRLNTSSGELKLLLGFRIHDHEPSVSAR